MSFTSNCRYDDILKESSFPDSKDVSILQDTVYAFVSSKIIFTACELNVFDVLAKSEVPLSAKAVAECLGTSIRGTQCLLDGCMGLNVLETHFQNGEDDAVCNQHTASYPLHYYQRGISEVYYKNTQLSQCYLTKGGSRSLFNVMEYVSNYFYPALTTLKDSVRQGSSVNTMESGDNFFKEIYRSEDHTLQYMQYIESSWNLHSKEALISAFDLSSYKTICDLGGCSGTLTKVCSSMFPTSSIILYDLPEVIQVAQKHFKLQEKNISFQQGDFFVDPLPNADLFILSRIIHDWDDDTCLKLLKRIYTALEPDGGILIIDAILNEDRTGHALVHLQNAIMFMYLNGRERTITEHKMLLESAGFKDIQFSLKNILSGSILGRK